MEEYDRVPRHAEQTCKNSRLDELEAEKKLLMKSVPPYDPKAPRSKNVEKLDKVPCSRIRLRREAMKRVLEKRWEIEKECFGGKPDPGHDTTMTELEQGIRKTEKLEKRNCAPSHPMAGVTVHRVDASGRVCCVGCATLLMPTKEKDAVGGVEAWTGWRRPRKWGWT
ncbi:hypothetical protein [Cystobacter ferrugineus]|uniref:hypothetical protein n=1 Tax=Cystobacter ferrugineus TaxID=83449 RepID=UPI001161248F|nr:hypothetical protein [Cystobacter ferrugineus]